MQFNTIIEKNQTTLTSLGSGSKRSQAQDSCEFLGETACQDGLDYLRSELTALLNQIQGRFTLTMTVEFGEEVALGATTTHAEHTINYKMSNTPLLVAPSVQNDPIAAVFDLHTPTEPPPLTRADEVAAILTDIANRNEPQDIIQADDLKLQSDTGIIKPATLNELTPVGSKVLRNLQF